MKTVARVARVPVTAIAAIDETVAIVGVVAVAGTIALAETGTVVAVGRTFAIGGYVDGVNALIKSNRCVAVGRRERYVRIDITAKMEPDGPRITKGVSYRFT